MCIRDSNINRPARYTRDNFELTSNNYDNLFALYISRPTYLFIIVVLQREPIHRLILLRTLLCPRPTLRGQSDTAIRRPSICLSVCLSVPFCDSCRSLDMGTSPFHTHSIGGSTVGYAHVQVLSAGAYRFAARYLFMGAFTSHISSHLISSDVMASEMN